MYDCNIDYKCCYYLEVPNIMDAKQLEMLKNWNGELRYLQNFVLKRIGKIHLESSKSKPNEAITLKDRNVVTNHKTAVNMDVEWIDCYNYWKIVLSRNKK